MYELHNLYFVFYTVYNKSGPLQWCKISDAKKFTNGLISDDKGIPIDTNCKADPCTGTVPTKMMVQRAAKIRQKKNIWVQVHHLQAKVMVLK